jgi:hypothetical protein
MPVVGSKYEEERAPVSLLAEQANGKCFAFHKHGNIILTICLFSHVLYISSLFPTSYLLMYFRRLYFSRRLSSKSLMISPPFILGFSSIIMIP